MSPCNTGRPYDVIFLMSLACFLLRSLYTPTAPADPIIAVAFLATIIHGIINSEVALAKELAEKVPQMDAGGVWRGGAIQETRYVWVYMYVLLRDYN